jgi:hypothetical protein
MQSRREGGANKSWNGSEAVRKHLDRQRTRVQKGGTRGDRGRKGDGVSKRERERKGYWKGSPSRMPASIESVNKAICHTEEEEMRYSP